MDATEKYELLRFLCRQIGVARSGGGPLGQSTQSFSVPASALFATVGESGRAGKPAAAGHSTAHRT